MSGEKKTQKEGSAEFQGKLWGLRAKDWANQEIKSKPYFADIISKMRRGNTSLKLLDIGCGSGVLCKMAHDIGYEVTGLDASHALLEEAGKRLGKDFFIQGDMEFLPFEDETFDIVAAITSIQFASDSLNALNEAKRVLKNGGQFIMGIWGDPAKCEAVKVISGMRELAPPPPQGNKPALPVFINLFEEGKLEKLLKDINLRPTVREEVTFSWNYISREEMERSFLSAGGISLAIQHSGEKKVMDTLRDLLREFQKEDGSGSISNSFIYVIAEKQ